jgi:alpha-amylase/alpha-mannosidase (GH57 family)
MSVTPRNLYLCIHGHFYQPPRENAWTENIEIQESAYPFHDWNERIFYESYLPNTQAKVYDDKGYLIDLVNNFDYMNFNFGPTLISWIEKKHPDIYEKIIEADKRSVKERNGHGNAIAQVYNHMIMPLANERDKITQIKWGLRDFEYRFKRKSEGIWLAETACNEATLEALVDEGIKYLILEPTQAERVCKMKIKDSAPSLTSYSEDKVTECIDVSHGGLNPKIPYRCFLEKNPHKYIDIFFYDGPISKAVSFEDLLTDAKIFASRIESAADASSNYPQLISIATDGETYGHHKKYGDRVLAYLLKIEAPRRGFKVVNYAEYLEENAPRYTVKLKAGHNGEGTSWSCPHGVSRWKEHCGCRGDGPAEWTQEWRGPLRDTLDFLRDELIKIFECQASKYFKNPWEARNNYIDVVLDRSLDSIGKFFENNALDYRSMRADEITNCLKLFEMQRNAMLMYTSCAWFFTELSGIETVQVIQYAARALELAKHLSAFFDLTIEPLRLEFFKRLSLAQSNIPELKNAQVIYQKYVRPSIVSPKKLIANLVINSLFEEEEQEKIDYDCFLVKVLKKRQESFGNLRLSFGRVQVSSKVTLECMDFVYCVLQFGTFDFRCSIKSISIFKDMDTAEEELFNALYSAQVVDLLRSIDHYFGKEYFSLQDMLQADRINVVSELTKEIIEEISRTYDSIYEKHRMINEIYQTINLPIPPEIYFATEFSLNKKLSIELEELAVKGFDPNKFYGVVKILQIGRANKVRIDTGKISKFLSNELGGRILKLKAFFNGESENDADIVQESINIINFAEGLKIPLRFEELQLQLYKALEILPKKIDSGVFELADRLMVKIKIEKHSSSERLSAKFEELSI